jgi:hypothetical protein
MDFGGALVHPSCGSVGGSRGRKTLELHSREGGYKKARKPTYAFTPPSCHLSSLPPFRRGLRSRVPAVPAASSLSAPHQVPRLPSWALTRHVSASVLMSPAHFPPPPCFTCLPLAIFPVSLSLQIGCCPLLRSPRRDAETLGFAQGMGCSPLAFACGPTGGSEGRRGGI